MLSSMFTVSEADAAVIRVAYKQRGELSAAVELRRLFPGVLRAVSVGIESGFPRHAERWSLGGRFGCWDAP